MSKKALALAVAIGVAVFVTGAILIFQSGEDSAEPTPQTNEEVTVSLLPSGWQLVTSSPLGVSIEVPPAWKVGHINGNIEAVLGDGENQELGIGAELIIYSYPNPNSLTPEEWVKEKGINSFSKIIKDGREGTNYETKLVEQYYRGGKPQTRFIEGTYILGNIFSVQDKIIEITCALSGANYKSLIPTCEEIAGSFQFIE